MQVVPLTLKEANVIVEKLHRHHKPVQGCKFSIGLVNNENEIIGACICGRPVARMCSSYTLEVTRLVTSGYKNACSKLYGTAASIAKLMGYYKIQTYILQSEIGTSLKASGWICEDNNCGGGIWKHTDGKQRRTDQPSCKKQRWVKYLRNPAVREWRQVQGPERRMSDEH